MKGHYLLLTAAVAGLLALAFALGRTGQAPVNPAGEQIVEDENSGYDFSARDVSVTQTDAEGRLLYAFTAEQVQQADNDMIDASNLTLQYDPPGESTVAQRWTVRADTAQLPEQGGVLALLGNVQAHGQPAGSGAPLVIRTDKLDYDMRGQTLRTKSTVRFEWNDRELTGTGLDADLNAGKFKLESKVRGHVSF
ncbi:MAG: LPS export ABC transporter periplasmic protein LptC [Nevskiaceae bacterium]|jgi:LPS export ABC transporter protein LptC|nr:LPS export ABC transporter periplasmic protein LptC [Nevskiaceae bacterium]